MHLLHLKTCQLPELVNLYVVHQIVCHSAQFKSSDMQMKVFQTKPGPIYKELLAQSEKCVF